MYLIQILLPLNDNEGKPFPSSKFLKVQNELTRKYGGITAHLRSPASGRWSKNQKIMHDDIVLVEVMIKKLNKAWWKRYRAALEKAFMQDELIIRAHKTQTL